MSMKRSVRSVLFVLLCGMVLPAFADTQLFDAIVGYRTPRCEGPVYLRYYTRYYDQVNAGGSGACANPNVWEPPYCEVAHTDKPEKRKVGYKGYLESIASWGNQPCGTVFCAVWDTEFGTGSPEHRGYYAWMCKPVNCPETQDIWAPGCTGTADYVSCLGSADPDNAAGHEVENTPLGTLEPWGGFRPLPVPLPQGVEGDTVHLAWIPVGVLGDTSIGEACYDLYYVVREPEEGCTAPLADEFLFLRTVCDTRADVTTDQLGIDPDGDQGVFFALRVRYPPAGGGTEVVSRYLSANSQCILFHGQAATVVNLRARWLRANVVEVSWETELEDGLVGFYVERGWTAEGPFERVSDLVPARGEPSRYAFLDEVTANGRVAATGAWYRVVAVEGGEEETPYGPVKTETPDLPRPARIPAPGP